MRRLVGIEQAVASGDSVPPRQKNNFVQFAGPKHACKGVTEIPRDGSFGSLHHVGQRVLSPWRPSFHRSGRRTTANVCLGPVAKTDVDAFRETTQ
jgi:hypothetical protein